MRLQKANLHKRLLVGLLAPVPCILLFLFTLSISNMIKINHFVFDRSARKILVRAEELTRKAVNFDQSTILSELGPNPMNSFYYRFDENLVNAHHVAQPREELWNGKYDQSICFEFDDKDNLLIRPSVGDFAVEDGLLKCQYDGSNILESLGELTIDEDSIGEIELRLKLRDSRRVVLAWSPLANARISDRSGISYLGISTIPDGHFHIYRVDATPLKGFLEPGDSIRKIFLFPDTNPDEVEIDYIRFLSKMEKYAHNPYGVGYETINAEMRKILYVYPNSSLSYRLRIPDGESVLQFGVGTLIADDPVEFSITIETDGLRKNIFAKEISNQNGWYDAVVSLSPYANQTARISFSTKASGTNIAFWTNPGVYSIPEQRMNIVIVLEDALRADRLSCYGYPDETSPVKDKWAEKGIVFLNAFSQCTHTRSSCVSFMTSMYPSATGVWNASEILDDKYLTLAEIMRSQGFATASFIQNVNAGSNVGLHQGFDMILDHETVGIRADEVYESSVLHRWLESNRNRNFFLYLHLFDPHGAYAPPVEFISQRMTAVPQGKTPVEKDDFFDPAWLETPTVESRNLLYDEEIRYNDIQLETLMKMLIDNRLLKNTMIVFIADHGEHLGEHLVWGHQPPGFRQVLHVPMIMIYPEKLPTNRTIRQPVQLLDLMPTILDIAGIETRHLLLAGESLLPLIAGAKLDSWDDRLCLSEEVMFAYKNDPESYGSIFYQNLHILNSDTIDGFFSGIVRGISKDSRRRIFTTRIFDLLKDRDEQHGATSSLLDIWLQYKIRRFFQQIRRQNMITWEAITGNTKQPVIYDSKTVEQLRSLGYIE